MPGFAPKVTLESGGFFPRLRRWLLKLWRYLLDWLKNFVGKRFIASLLTILFIGLNKKLGLNLDDATITHIVQVLIGFLGLQTVSDMHAAGTKALKESMPAQPPAGSHGITTTSTVKTEGKTGVIGADDGSGVGG